MHLTTRLLHPTTVASCNFAAVQMPIHRASTVLFPTMEAFAARHTEPKPDYIYGTNGTPTTRALELAMAASEGANGCVLVSSGLEALSLVNLALLKSGDHVLVGDNNYEPNRSLFSGFLNKMGITYTSFNPLDIASLTNILNAKPNTRLVWIEPVGSNTQEVCDIPAIAAAVQAVNAYLAVDHTWTAGVLLDVFAQGADVAIQAMTKYQCGHSDILMGSITWCNPAIGTQIQHAKELLGHSVSPDDCALILRGMQTLHLRLKEQGTASIALAQWLQNQPAVNEVLHPALPNTAGHVVWQRDYNGKSAALFAFTLKSAYDMAAAYRLVNSLKLFGIGASWGGVHSLALVQTIRREVMPRPTGELIRLSIGLEHINDLKADLTVGLAAL